VRVGISKEEMAALEQRVKEEKEGLMKQVCVVWRCVAFWLLIFYY